MKSRYIFIWGVLLVCLGIFGQQKKTVSVEKQPHNTSSQVVTDYQETIMQLQAENEAMQKQLERIEKEIEWCRGDVRIKTSEMNTNMALWLSVLTIIMAVLGVVVPLILNRRNEQNIKNLLEDAKTEANLAKEQAKRSEEAFKSIQPQVKSVREQANTAKEQAIKAEESAKEAKARYLFIYAENEDDPSIEIDLYTQIIDLYPKIPEAYLRRARLSNNLEEALKDYNKAIELDPNYIDALLSRGGVKMQLNDNSSAIEDFNRVVELAPNDLNVYSYRGIAKENLGDYTGAMIDFDKAIEICPGAYQYLNRGKLKYLTKDIIGALSDFNKSIEKYPNDSKSYESRAKCYRKLAEAEQNKEKDSEWIAKAEADEKKVIEIKTEIEARIEAQNRRIEMMNKR